MLCGPKGVGKSSLLSLLSSDYSSRLCWVQPITTKPYYKGEEEKGASAFVVPYAVMVSKPCLSVCNACSMCLFGCRSVS